jgi:uncharacterized membrane protein YbhN (UPF0104 family)
LPEPASTTPDRSWRARLTRLTHSIEHGAVALREWSSRHVRVLAIAAALLFIALSVIGIRAYSRLHLHPDLWLLAPAAVFGALLLTFLNAGEYWCGAVLARHHPSAVESITVSIAGSAANLLPVPGAVIVRNYAMVSGGATVAGALGGTVVVALAWVGVTAVVLGAIVLATDLVLGIVLSAVGLAMVVAVVLAVRRRLPGREGTIVWSTLLGVELVTVGVEIGRYWLVLAALGAHPTLLRTVPLVGANVVAAASIVFPGGLGIREALAGGFAAAANLPAAVGIAASALDRLALTAMFAVSAGVLGLWRRRHQRASATSGVVSPDGTA